MSGTSNGMVTNFNGTLWSQQSYFDFLRQHGVSWRAYYQDDPWAIMYYEDMQNPPNSLQVFELEQFFSDVANGTLSQFTFLQPRMTSTNGMPTWQHPDSPVSEGERLIAQVYMALRHSAFWDSVAFVITYDEHGGFYDHVPPPQHGVPPPDGVVSEYGFTFDRLGIRVPTVVISPWVKKGLVVHEPTNGPQATSQYESTSIMATCNRVFGVEAHMTARDAWAGTFEHIFGAGLENKPRTDCPTRLPRVRATSKQDFLDQWARPLNDHMEIQVRFYCRVNHRDDPACGRDITNQKQASLFLVREAQVFMQRAKQLPSSQPQQPQQRVLVQQ